MSRIPSPLDDPFFHFATETPVARRERTPLDIMVETAANEEQFFLAGRQNHEGQPGANDYTGYLSQNQHLNFVQRLIEPDKYPRIDNPDGSYSTHLMASARAGGKEIAFPTIIQGENGKLEKLSMNEAIKYALKHQEYIEFPTQEEADAFASGAYKTAATKLWGNKY